MKIDLRKIEPAFTDARGDIIDVFVGELHHAGVLTFTQAAERGNHFHKLQTQYTYMLSGKVEMRARSSDDPSDPVETVVMVPGDFVTIPPGTVHGYKALEPSTMICLTTRERGTAAEYEEDTVRVASLF